MSARRVCAARFAVFACVIVTVAFPRSESWASMIERGAPTRSPYPTTTTSAPSSGMSLRSSSSTIPYGVAGWNVASPRTTMPTFHGWSPSTSFSGAIVRCTSSSFRCAGSGSWTMIPWISGSRLRRRIVASISPPVTYPGG